MHKFNIVKVPHCDGYWKMVRIETNSEGKQIPIYRFINKPEKKITNVIYYSKK